MTKSEKLGNHIKKIAAGLAVTLILSGCGQSENQPAQIETATESAAATQEQTEETTEPTKEVEQASITVSSEYGEVEIPISPEKVVVFDMGVLDSLDYLGVDVDLALPIDNIPSYLSKYETAINAGGIKEPNMEAIYEFEPDLIIISGRQSSFYEELNKIAPTWYINIDYNNLLADFEETYTTLGKVFEKEKESINSIEEIKKQIETVADKASQLSEKALILLTNDGTISAYGSGSRFGVIHDVLLVNPADEAVEASTHGQSVGYEYIAQVNPDILFVIDRTAIVAGTAYASDTLKNDLVQSTNAYKNEKIIYLNPEIWYLAGVGLNTFPMMIEEVEQALN